MRFRHGQLRAAFAASIFALGFVPTVQAIWQMNCTASSSAESSFSVVRDGKAAPIFIAEDEWPGVQLAASNFVIDIHNVTGVRPSLTNETNTVKSSTPPIIVGTLGKSSLISAIVNHTRLDVSSIENQWEAWLTQEIKNPLPGIDSAYVMIGADKRGTIFAIYDHSEQFGVSPWYWWADVPVKTSSSLAVLSSGCSQGTPTVKYRGVFLNDEQPALQNWAMLKFTNGTGSALTDSPLNHFFYDKLFEVLLRIKANYLWPAQWSSAFGVDDPVNQFMADMYGIVMGTSHEEPMMRSTPVEWDLFGVGPWDFNVNAENITAFWVEGVARSKTYENIYTVGMRGSGDLPIDAANPIETLDQIITVQRGILENAYPEVNVTTIPQMWCLYKEVEGYYDEGLTVPDDVTLLWTDDNWGNIRRFPTPDERNRTGGAGVYYHYDYVGDPVDYKWISTTQISKTYEQMAIAVSREATRIWIVNVGDFKPFEMEIEFFITLGLNASLFNPDNLNDFVGAWAQREFGVDEDTASKVAVVLANMTRYNNRRKPELVNATTYSLTNYREAENMVNDWVTLNASAHSIYNSLDESVKPAFTQLVLHEVQASANLGIMWIHAGINNLRASEARISTNDYADSVQTYFEQDWELEESWNGLLDGKWAEMMSQTHVVYYYWQQPMANTMPPVQRIMSKKMVLAGPIRISPEYSLATWPGDNPNQCAQQYSCPPATMFIDAYVPAGNRYIDVGAGGPSDFTFTVSSNASWVKLNTTKGSISPSADENEKRVLISVDWDQVEGSVGYAEIWFNATLPGNPPLAVPASAEVQVYLVADHTAAPSNFSGFVEGDGGISIEAAHAARNTSVQSISWTNLPDYGRTLSGVKPLPDVSDLNFTAGSGPSLEYDFYNFNTIGGNGTVIVTTYVSPSFNSNGAGNSTPIAFATQIDSQEPQTNYFFPLSAPGETPPQWDGLSGFVANSIIAVQNNFTAEPGAHTLTIWMVEPAVVVQKIVIDTGGVMESYLGPPESIRL